MKKFLETLESLDARDTLFASTDKLVFLLSGQSDYVHSELSNAQKTLLAAFKPFGYACVETGFPFNRLHDFHGCARSGLLRASIRNLQQFAALRFSGHYRALVARHLQPAFTASRDIFVVCQSAGLEMLTAALPMLAIGAESSVSVLALGPVASRRFGDRRIRLCVVKGRHDWLSRLLDRNAVTFETPCGHMDYCSCPETLELIPTIVSCASRLTS